MRSRLSPSRRPALGFEIMYVRVAVLPLSRLQRAWGAPGQGAAAHPRGALPPALPGGITVPLALTTRLFSPSPSSLVQVHSHSGAGERGGLVSPGQSAVGAHPHLPGEKPAGLRGRKQLVAERDQHGRASGVHRVSGQRVWECQAGGPRLSRLGKGLQLLCDETDGTFLSIFFPLLPHPFPPFRNGKCPGHLGGVFEHFWESLWFFVSSGREHTLRRQKAPLGKWSAYTSRLWFLLGRR